MAALPARMRGGALDGARLYVEATHTGDWPPRYIAMTCLDVHELRMREAVYLHEKLGLYAFSHYRKPQKLKRSNDV